MDLKEIIWESEGRIATYFQRYPDIVCKLAELCKKGSGPFDPLVPPEVLIQRMIGKSAQDVYSTEAFITVSDTSGIAQLSRPSSHRLLP
jgi:hypothetical protein